MGKGGPPPRDETAAPAGQRLRRLGGPNGHVDMRPRPAGIAALFCCCLALSAGCTRRASGPPFGYSAHPYTHAQIQAMLGTFPNPGPNMDNVVRDASGNLVEPPDGDAAFATELVLFEPGRPAAIVEGSDPREALGLPDYGTNIWEPPHALSLGNGGMIVLRLVGEPLVDRPGPDLFVFEAGPSREAVSVETW
jgi:hypothetical protein